MKHLKKFNESLNKEELQDFCDTYLAYLLDEGYSIVNRGDSSNSWIGKYGPGYGDDLITLKKGNDSDRRVQIDSPEFLFTWDEIKDQFIPFLHMLSKKYTITNIKFWIVNKRITKTNDETFIDYDYNLPMVLEDRVSLEEIVQISIYLK